MSKRTRPIEGVQRRYIFRLYPTKEQDINLRLQAGMCAQLWNALLEICEQRYRSAVQGRCFHCADCAQLSEVKGKVALCSRHKMPSYETISGWITEMRAVCPEWRALSVYTPRRVAISLTAAFEAFFRRIRSGDDPGYPHYKSSRHHFSLPHNCNSGCKVNKSDRHKRSWTLRLHGITDDIWARGMVPASINEWTHADIIYRNNHWELSVAVDIKSTRMPMPIRHPITIRFDLLDGFALINDETETPQGLIDAQLLENDLDVMKSRFDCNWPRGRRYDDVAWSKRCEAKAEIGKLSSYMTRIRRNALHVWTARLAARASMMVIIRPPIKQSIKSPRGNEKEWGANVKTVSALNRNTLSYAPATAIAMLKYKAEELGIRCDIIDDDSSNIAIGASLVAAGKTMRKAKRAIKKEREHDRSGTRKYEDA